MNAQAARVESLNNQLLVILDGYLPDIERIADQIPQTDRDGLILAMTTSFVAGLLRKRRAEAATI